MIRLKETATRLILTGTDAPELRRIAGWFKFRPTNYWRSPSYEQFQITGGEKGWDGWTRPLKIDGSDQLTAVLPRGYKDDLLEHCRNRGVAVDTRKLLECPFVHLQLADIPADLLPGIVLDRYQLNCLHGWLRNAVGICNVTVSGGKTATFAAAARMLKKEHGGELRILYITQSERLVRQAHTEMRRFLPELHITRYGGGERGKGRDKETGQDSSGRDMVVATTAILNRNFDELLAGGFFRTFMAVFYDEVHHAASKTSQKILDVMPAFYRFGASDTQKVEDPSKFNLIKGHFGGVRAVTPASPLIQMDRIARPRHYLVDVAEWHNRLSGISYRALPDSTAVVLEDGTWKKGVYLGPVYERNKEGQIKYRKARELAEDGTWLDVKKPVVVPGVQEIELDGERQEIESRWLLLDRAYDKAVIRFKERNDLIVEWATYFSVDKGYQTLVVCTRTLHIYILESLLKRAHPDPEKVDILFGWATGKQRDDMFAWFRETPGAVLITPLVKEGVSINEIRAGIVADNVADWEVANQITGRFMRKKLDGGPNEAEIVWFVDRQHPALRRNAAKVFKRLEQINGYNFYHPLAGPSSLKHALEFKTPDLPLD